MEIISWRSVGTQTSLKHCKITRKKQRIRGCFCWMCKLHMSEREMPLTTPESTWSCIVIPRLSCLHGTEYQTHLTTLVRSQQSPGLWAAPAVLGIHPPLEQGDPAATGAVTSDPPMPALPVAWVHSPLSCLSLRVPPAAGSCQVPVCLRSSHWWAHSSPACAAAFLRALLWAVPTAPSSPQPQTLPALPQEQLHKLCSGMESGGFGLCDHRAEGSAPCLGGVAGQWCCSTPNIPAQHPPALLPGEIPFPPSLAQLGDWGNPWSWVGEGHF